MSQTRHPLTTLEPYELPGFIVCARLAVDQMTRAGTAEPTVARFALMLEIAEGLLERHEEESNPGEEEGQQEDPAEVEAEAAQEGLADAVALDLADAISPPPKTSPAPVTVWTPERLAVLEAGYRDNRSRQAIFEEINRLAGPPCASVAAMGVKASSLGLKAGTPTAATSPIIQAGDAITDEDRAVARQAILNGQGARHLVEEFGWPADLAQAFAQQVRAEAQGAA